MVKMYGIKIRCKSMFYLYHFDPTFMLEGHPVLARDLRTVLHCRSPVGPGQRPVCGGGGGAGGVPRKL